MQDRGWTVIIVAIDPGHTHTAMVRFTPHEQRITYAGILPNEEMREKLIDQHPDAILVAEMIACYGMAVGAEVFETCVWIGRFVEAWGGEENTDWFRLKRLQCKMHLCHDSRAKDSNIRQALIDRFGAPGTKKNKGGTYGISKDMWAALAVAVTFADTNPICRGEVAA